MRHDRTILVLALLALATPALAEKCSVCDFSDEPIVVKPAKQSDHDRLSSGFGNDDVLDEGRGLTAEPTTQEGTFFGKVVRAGMELARREKERQQAAPELQLGKSDERAVREHISMNFEKIVWNYHPDAGSSKPKEIVVVGSKIRTPAADVSKADGRHALTSVQHAAPVKGEFGGWIADVERPVVVGRLPAQAAVVPAGAALPRGAGSAALPGKVEFGAVPAARR